MKKVVPLLLAIALLAALFTGCNWLSVCTLPDRDSGINLSALSGDAASYKSVLEAYASWGMSEASDQLPEPWGYLYAAPAQENCYYALKDLNGNGSPELILLINDYELLAIYSLVNGQPVEVYAHIMKGTAVIDASGTLYGYYSGGADIRSWSIRELAPDDSRFIHKEGIYREESSETGVYCYRDTDTGEKTGMSEPDYERLAEQYSGMSNQSSGLTLIPLFK